jgi:Flp pilus assembly protein TadG
MDKSLRRRHSRSGNAMLETALTIIPLLAILCAIIDFSMALFIRNSVELACREGVRYAITGNTGAGGNACQTASVKYIVQQDSMGFLSGATGLSHITVSYLNPITLTSTASNAQGNIVQVSVTGISWLWMLNGVWQNVDAVKHGPGTNYSGGITIGGASSDILGPYALGIAPCE